MTLVASFFFRLQAAIAVFFAPTRFKLYPARARVSEVELWPGLIFQPHLKRLLITDELKIEGLENLSIVTKKHLFLESGGTPEEGRPGYLYSIWNNSRVRDEQGRPVSLVPIWSIETDAMDLMPQPLTADGNLAVDPATGFYPCPEGFRPLPKDAWAHHMGLTPHTCGHAH